MKVTAIVPVHNGGAWLSNALASIQWQTKHVDEIIVVDDGSTDNSSMIAAEFGANIIKLPQNLGPGAARNAGLNRAAGDVIAWLDADDVWAPHHVGVLLSLMERYPHAAAAFAATQRFGLRSELIKGYIPLGEPTNVFWLAVDDWLHIPTASMTRRDAVLSVGGFSSEKRPAEDYDLWLRLSRTHLFVCTHEVTSFWRWHTMQTSQNYSSQLISVYYFRNKYWNEQIKGGDHELAQQLGARIRFLWERDFQRALNEGKSQLIEALKRARRFVPEPI